MVTTNDMVTTNEVRKGAGVARSCGHRAIAMDGSARKTLAKVTLIHHAAAATAKRESFPDWPLISVKQFLTAILLIDLFCIFNLPSGIFHKSI